MIKSKFFWMAATCFALVPLLVIDIAQHRIDWQKEVREEVIMVVQNMYAFSREQKATILDKVFDRNSTLTFLMYSKSIACIVLPGLGIHFLRLYRRQPKPGNWKPVIFICLLVTAFIIIKLFFSNLINTRPNIQFLAIQLKENSLENIYNQHFRGKVLYVDFWGTTCGPCLQEFRNFTQPLKEKYKARHDIAYLYIAQGSQYLWKEQIKKYNVEGFHAFVNESQYEQLYRHSTKDSTGPVLMPRYVIFDKTGNIVETQAKQPSNGNLLYTQINRYLGLQ